MSTDKIQTIRASLAQIEADRADPQQRADDLRAQIAEKRGGVKLRDWTVTGHRPSGAHVDNNSAEQTRAVRTQFQKEARALEEQLSEVNDELSDLRQRENTLREELRLLEKAAVTPATFDARIRTATNDLAKHRGTRHRLESEQAQAKEQHKAARNAIAAEQPALTALDDARADAFLASPGAAETPAVKAAKTRLSEARERAASARAALPQIEARMTAAADQLVTFDEECASRQAVITRLERERDVLIAKLKISTHVDGILDGLRALNAVDGELADRLGKAFHSRGLYSLDGDNQLQQPEVIQVWHDVRVRRRMLTESESL